MQSRNCNLLLKRFPLAFDLAVSTLPNIDLEYQHGTDVVLRRVGAGEATAGVLLRPRETGPLGQAGAHR